jgi:small conductance mechanosensitive channel
LILFALLIILRCVNACRFIPPRQEGAMEAINNLVEKIKQFPELFNDPRFTANVIAIHGLAVVAILACLLLRRMLARGGHRLIERTGWNWIEPVVEEALRHGRRLVLWLMIAATLLLIVAGTLYHRAGRDIRQDAEEWRDKLSREDWIQAGYDLGIVVGILFAAWVGSRWLRRLRAKWEKRVLERLGGAGNEHALSRVVTLVLRYASFGLLVIALHIIDGIEKPGRDFTKILHLATRLFVIIAVAHILPRLLKSVSPNIANLGTRILGRTRFHRFWDRIARLFPLGERCFEYAVYIHAANIVMHMLHLFNVVDYFVSNTDAAGNLTASDLHKLAPNLVKCIGIFFGARVLIELVQVLVNQTFGLYSTDRQINQKARTLVPLLNSVCQYLLYFGAGVMMMEQLGMQTTPILAAASFLGLAVGLGAQNLVTDLVSGFFILFESQYLVGDYVQIGEAHGIVEEVGIRLTQIRDGHGKLHIIPNGQIKGVVNFSKGYVNAVVDVKAASGSDLESILRTMTEAGRRLRQLHPEVLADTQIQGLVELSASEMSIRSVTKVRPGSHEAMANEYRRLLKLVFDEKPAQTRIAA